MAGFAEDSEPLGASRWGHDLLIAGAIYWLTTLFIARVILGEPATVVPSPHAEHVWAPLVLCDLRMVLWQIARNARVLLMAPCTLFDSGQCFPFANAVTLGEHMFGEGLLGAFAYGLSRDPVLTYNFVLVVKLWFAAIAMYCLVYHWTRNGYAAFLAGFLFAFQQTRLAGLMRPFVVGNEWTPLALLFADRLFRRGRWLDAAGLLGSICLQMLESFYPIFGLFILGGVYGSFLLLRHWRRLPRVLPKLLLVVGAVVALAIVLMVPYVHTQRTWGKTEGRTGVTFFLSAEDVQFGHLMYPGTVLLVLACLGIADRILCRRFPHREDPRWIFLAAVPLIFWSAAGSVTIPGVVKDVPSLLRFVSGVIPGASSVRGGGSILMAAYLVASFLAGYGLLLVVGSSRPVVSFGLTAILATVALAEVAYAPLARQSFGASVAWEPLRVRPAEQLMQLYSRLPQGAVLDLPLPRPGSGLTRFVVQTHYLLMAAFHHQPVEACYNSFGSPLQRRVDRLALRLPDSGAADALYAIGFRSIVVHREFAAERRLVVGLQGDEDHFVEIGRANRHLAYRIRSHLPSEETFAVLRGSASDVDHVQLAPSGALINFTIRNWSQVVYHHPAPMEPTPLVARWYSRGQLVRQDDQLAMLPLALVPGESSLMPFWVVVPDASGEYEVQVAVANDPELVIARAIAVVRAEEAPGDR
jgi:hypothetical protein